MHRQRLDGKLVHTWATIRHALSIEGLVHNLGIISSMHVRDQDKSIMYHNQIDLLVNQSISHICGAPTKTRLFYMN